MNLPFFFNEHIVDHAELLLDEDNSRHIVSVLRMEAGEEMHLTNGKGVLATAVIAEPHKKKCRVTITGIERFPPAARRTAIGISLLKNPVRFEWFLEKAAELGIAEIFPLLCARTEKQHFRQQRMQNVLVSALLQSRQTWMPVLYEPMTLEKSWTHFEAYQQRFIAHCETDPNKRDLMQELLAGAALPLVLIGPEGDFSPAEITSAIERRYKPVSLGTTRLRTETAGITAAVLLQLGGVAKKSSKS
ncbi:MAG: 16S rRNA (uracil(1498)-N(3))-methyltransferase [Bacteroidota bacterium]|nr:16S rRNA (uracil(1498)-N(3))-methyltransferase [Bacteroidota bacterium]